jgi:trans-4-hydroxy-L-proline dehydratase
VPWEPAETFWEAVQSLWLTHMLVMSDENYPGRACPSGASTSTSTPTGSARSRRAWTAEFRQEILKCFWIHCNTAYDAMIRTGGNQGITAGYGQLITLSGMGADGQDMTNDLTYAILEVIDEMSPILEPKPNVRLHRNTPGALLDKVVEMIASSQGAPFLLNFRRALDGRHAGGEKRG